LLSLNTFLLLNIYCLLHFFLNFFHFFRSRLAILIFSWNVAGRWYLFRWWRGRRALLIDLFLFRRRILIRNHNTGSIVSLRNDNFLSKPKIRIKSTTSLFCQIIISSISAIKIVISFKPLCEFQIILILSLGKLFNLNRELATSRCLFIPTLLKDYCSIFRLLINS
jgi:hypothetical protein